ncbi:Riboflavin biosynthesis protein RibBA (plasmid) [Sphingobium sp. AntQ-1]|uniref:3,4-dihydroxy-2-butanone-4-phosphate synthase n=1 Tax=Sphingobium sp. AntQ-1 TaxID=2930091 RepID=UPI00234E631A|nr:3,4-dihydroxy-2-butanone-4-phosphate synthase [Sphingobium sp. AntQ-1]WCP16247.1 Riboflavin biosynthesis protein RibBA [Sphingobium sp. AntQ-1]
MSGGAQAGPIASVEEIIDEARNGRMFILVDDEDHENEGDLVIPAQMATPDAINFMAKHGRGLICLALTKERSDALQLTPMSQTNGTRHETAFTVSIEARHGVTTGISASDRARTVSAAIDASKGPDDLVTPGHIFPLVARPGGVLVRAGHTEAAVDVSRLAGLNPSGVICEIMRDDGTMARLDDLVVFAHAHCLKIGTIRDLIAYRRRHDNNVEKLSEATFETAEAGRWKVVGYRNRAADVETLALIKGDIDTSRPTLVRMHALDLFADALDESCDRRGVLARAMKRIHQEGAGVIVILHRLVSIDRLISARNEGRTQEMAELRDYGLGAQILAEMGIHEVVLLTGSQRTPVAIAGYGLEIVGTANF